MSEVTGKYEVEENDASAIEMMNADRPAITIESPRREMQRRGRKMVEVEIPAFVKFSTDFKAELADIDVYALKVFIYIGLSIGYDTGTAFPGVRKIAKETKMDKDTVIKAIGELENKGFLTVSRRDGNSNIYRPDCYFAIGDSVPSGRTVDEIPSDEGAELSDEKAKLSDGSRVKRAQQDKQELTKVLLSIENAIAAGLPITEEMLRQLQTKDKATKQFENALGFSKSLPWWVGKDWSDFAAWVCDRYAENPMCFGEYNIWRNTQYTKGGMTNNRIRGFVKEFYDSWDMFMMSKRPAEQPSRPEHKRYEHKEVNHVPNPNPPSFREQLRRTAKQLADAGSDFGTGSLTA